MNIYNVKPYRDRRSDPIISVYIINDHHVLDSYNTCEGYRPYLEKISCIYCKRTVWDMYGRIDKMITTPMPPEDFGIATNIQCKQCHQKYRLLINAK